MAMNENMPAGPDSNLTALCQREIDALLETEKDIVVAMVASIDGFDMASANVQGWDVSINRLAAMASSGHALGNTVAQELVKGQCKNVVIDAERLNIVFQSVPKLESPPLILGVAAKKSTSLGTILYSATRCVGRIGDEWFKKFNNPGNNPVNNPGDRPTRNPGGL